MKNVSWELQHSILLSFSRTMLYFIWIDLSQSEIILGRCVKRSILLNSLKKLIAQKIKGKIKLKSSEFRKNKITSVGTQKTTSQPRGIIVNDPKKGLIERHSFDLAIQMQLFKKENNQVYFYRKSDVYGITELSVPLFAKLYYYARNRQPVLIRPTCFFQTEVFYE